MERVDVSAKLYELKSHLDGLSDADKAFVNSTIARLESGQMLDRHQILRIVDMRVPGEEESLDSTVRTQGMVTLTCSSLTGTSSDEMRISS